MRKKLSGKAVGRQVVSLILFLSLGQIDVSAQNKPVELKETTMEDSYRKLLEENTILRKKFDVSQDEIKKQNYRIELYADRIRDVTNRLEEAQRKIDTELAGKAEAETALVQELESLREENNKLTKLIVQIDMERGEEDYYEKWVETREELDMVSSRLENDSVEKERLRQENGKIHFNLGTIFFEKGDYERATYEFERALILMPNDTDAMYNLAVIYDYYVKDPIKAKQYYQNYTNMAGTGANKLSIKERMIDNDLQTAIEDNSYLKEYSY